MMEEADNAEHVIQTMQAEPSGLLRVTSIPCIFNGFFADLVGDFLQRYPRVRMDIVLDDRHLDFVADEIDVAFRIGPLLDSDLVARRICTASLVFCATPHYLAQHGMPLKPEDLHQHTIIRHPKGLVILNVNGEARHVDVPCRLQVNDHKLVQSLTRKHFGIGLMPRILAEEGLHKGSLVEILSDTPCVDKDLFLVYPSRKQLPSKIIAFVDMVMSNLPGEDSCLKLGDDDEVLLVDQGTVSRPRR
jgi:DNA-binding transcriptional LysR family regulator